MSDDAPDFIPADDKPDFIPYQGETTSTGIAAPQGTASGSAKDVLTGVAQGAASTVGNTVAGTARLIRKIPYIGEKIEPEEGINALEARTKERSTPENMAQQIGKTGEQVGEWLLPSGAEEKAASYVPRLMKPLARIGTGAIETGLRNTSQGGDFKTGAEAGGIAGAAGEGLKAAAPKIAESALGVTNRMRGHGKTIGKAILDETSGVRPSTILDQSGKAIGDLTGKLNTAAAASPVVAQTTPAIQVLDSAISKAATKNSGAQIDQLNKVRDQLTKVYGTGQAIPTDISAEKILNLKRGIGDLVGSWSPQEKRGIQPVIQQVYGALDKELDRAVPEAAGLNQRISSLIPAKQRAKIISNGAGVGQRIMGRMAAHTGALAGAGIGGTLGYERGGLPGAIVGGGMGIAVPEMLASPTTQMVGARIANSGIVPRFGKGIALQLDRPSAEDEEKKSREEE